MDWRPYSRVPGAHWILTPAKQQESKQAGGRVSQARVEMAEAWTGAEQAKLEPRGALVKIGPRAQRGFARSRGPGRLVNEQE